MAREVGHGWHFSLRLQRLEMVVTVECIYGLGCERRATAGFPRQRHRFAAIVEHGATADLVSHPCGTCRVKVGGVHRSWRRGRRVLRRQPFD